MPDMSTLPTVGLMVYKAARVAGEMSEPIESVPSEMGAYPAETPRAQIGSGHGMTVLPTKDTEVSYYTKGCM